MVLNIVSASVEPEKLTNVLKKALVAGNALGNGLRGLIDLVLERDKLELSVRALARVLAAVLKNDREACGRNPTGQLIELAVYLLIRKSSATARVALQEGKLQGLGAVEWGGAV